MTTTNTHVIDREALRRDGWQVIETEEEKRRFSPMLNTDEIWHEGFANKSEPGWCKMISFTNKFDDRTYRRRIPAPVEPQWHNPENVPADEVPKGWRFPVSYEELLANATRARCWFTQKAGFLFDSEGIHKVPSKAWSYVIPDTSPTPTPTAAPASGWVSTKDRLPTEADFGAAKYILGVLPNMRVAQFIHEGYDRVSNLLYWQPIPPLPEPVKPKSQQDLDYEEAWKLYPQEAFSPERHAYVAGKEAARVERARGGKGAA